MAKNSKYKVKVTSNINYIFFLTFSLLIKHQMCILMYKNSYIFIITGIYLCVVMTMTSLSVIMAVMVINIYNRGIKTKRAPMWLRTFTLQWMSRPLFLKHDLYKIASAISLVSLQWSGKFLSLFHTFVKKCFSYFRENTCTEMF